MYKTNFPMELNSTHRQYLSENFKTLEQDKQAVLNIIERHKKEDKNAHDSSQIKHGNSTVDKELEIIRGEVQSQVIGANGDGVAELKDMRVDTQGNVHELAQDRLMADFGLIGDVANLAKILADQHEKMLNESAYYSEITTTKGRNFDTTYYITHIPHTDKEGNLIKIKRGISGDINKPDHITPREFAKRTGATFVSNASTGSGSQLLPHGVQIYNGEIIKSVKDYDALEQRWSLAIGGDNTLRTYAPDVNAETLLAQGETNVLSGFGAFIQDNKITVKPGDFSPNTDVKHPRSVIAQLPNKDIVFFACDGRENNNKGFVEKGMTLQEVGETLFKHYGEITLAYNLDGGGSTSHVLRSTKLNKSQDENFTEERKVLDFLYVVKEPVQVRDKDIQNAYEDIGEIRNLVQKVYGELYKFNRSSSQEFGTTGYNEYTGLLAFDDDGNPRKKIYQAPEGWRFWDYDLSRTMFRITDDRVEHNNRTLARNYSNPETVTNINTVTFGGTYHVPQTATGSPYKNISSSIVTHYNVSAREFGDASTAFQVAVPFVRSGNYTMRRRTYAEGAWSQWFDV